MIQLARIIPRYAVLLAAFFAMAAAAYAQEAPKAPVNFSVRADGNSLNAPATLILEWKAAEAGGKAEKFIIYMGMQKENTPFEYKETGVSTENRFVIQGVQAGTYKLCVSAINTTGESAKSESKVITIKAAVNKEFAIISEPVKTALPGKAYSYQVKVQLPQNYSGNVIYSLVKAPDGMTITDNGLIEWKNPVQGTYSIKVAVQLKDAPNTTVYQYFDLKVGSQNDGKFVIISSPNTKACVNKEYVYEPKVQTSLSSTITWTLVQGPEGMKIDEKTGRITWTPSAEGEFKVIIKVTQEGQTTDQAWVINARVNCEDKPTPGCATLYGMVKDENGNGVKSGRVKAVRLEKDNSGPGSYTTEIRMGQWSLQVAEGTYALLFNGESFMEEWYQDSKEFKTATPVAVKCNEKSEINPVVSLRQKAAMTVIEGSVKNENGEMLAGILIQFSIVESNGKESGVYTVKTGENGTYRIEVPQNAIFIARAIPTGEQERKYLSIYYDGKQNAGEANRITTPVNIAINFTLPQRPAYQNGFAARLLDSNGTIAVAGKIVAIPVNGEKEPNKAQSRTAETDSNGNAIFSNLIPGEYILLGMPQQRTYAPGYYVNNDLAAQEWKNATRLQIGDAMIAQVFDIRLRAANGKKGGARIDGIINGRGAAKSASPLAESALGGALIIVKDQDGNISDYCLSDDKGSFVMLELAQGTFSLSADKPGFAAYSSTVQVDYAQNPVQQKNIILSSSQGATSVEENIAAEAQSAIYPNPASTDIYLPTNHANGVTINFVNSLGIVVHSTFAQVSNNLAQVNVQNLPAGAYTVQMLGMPRCGNGKAEGMSLLLTAPLLIVR
jgi:hypothetical protein